MVFTLTVTQFPLIMTEPWEMYGQQGEAHAYYIIYG